MAAAPLGTSEAAIFGRILDAGQAVLTVAAAENILEFGFGAEDKARMRWLLVQAKQGTLTAEEQAEIDHYESVGHLLSLMKSKARRLLKSRATTGPRADH